MELGSNRGGGNLLEVYCKLDEKISNKQWQHAEQNASSSLARFVKLLQGVKASLHRKTDLANLERGLMF